MTVIDQGSEVTRDLTRCSGARVSGHVLLVAHCQPSTSAQRFCRSAGQPLRLLSPSSSAWPKGRSLQTRGNGETGLRRDQSAFAGTHMARSSLRSLISAAMDLQFDGEVIQQGSSRLRMVSLLAFMVLLGSSGLARIRVGGAAGRRSGAEGPPSASRPARPRRLPRPGVRGTPRGLRSPHAPP